MQQISLENLVQHVSPQWLHLLTSKERSQSIVLRDGLQHLNAEDLTEIMGAVIQEHAKKCYYH